MAKTTRKIPSNQLKIQNTPTPTGNVIPLGYDSLGQPVDYTNNIALTYAQAATLVASSELRPGQYYQITDYRTKHRIPTTTDIHEGELEPLILRAISATKFAKEVYSPTYPKDIIEYDFDNALCEDGTTPRNGFITFRHDTIRNNEVGIDFRNVRYRRYKCTGRVWTEGISVNSTTVGLAISSNTPAFNRYFKYEVAFPVGLTHDSGDINIQITYNNGTTTKPILRYDTGTWTANQIANTSGILYYCRTRDSFVFITYGSVGNNLINKYVGIAPTTTQTLGDATVISLDPEDFLDSLIFNPDTARDVIIKYNAVSTYQVDDMNNIFYCVPTRVQILAGGRNNTFGVFQPSATMDRVVFSGLITDTVIETALVTSNFSNTVNRLYQVHFPSSFSNLHFNARGPLTWMTVRNPLAVSFFQWSEQSTVLPLQGSNIAFYCSLFESAVFINGNISTASTHQSVKIMSDLYRSVMGFFTWNHGSIDYHLANTSLPSIDGMSSTIKDLGVDLLKVKQLSTPTGAIRNIGLDAADNVVEYGLDSINYAPQSDDSYFVPPFM